MQSRKYETKYESIRKTNIFYSYRNGKEKNGQEEIIKDLLERQLQS